ncbi:capsular exopolysaccharide family [Ruegeria halocynthiae]|uniref:Capsular exopolysaccharide family n=1 Tax=Ruegeria halocynthiae TaxID=985054 RepID=A0A1H2Y469_9RHOB|nr:CpsD/CapB family tyrosine-protein kinase [Ruegeria halocynthiae]SDW99926.1 capsular exopolysaccharide family [Ruegeria halocynthiae]
MERIQAAIQKARESRQDQDEPEKAKGGTSPALAFEHDQQDQILPHSSADQLWAELTKIQLDPRQLHRARIIADQAGEDAASFDVLRTRMIHQMQSNNWRRVAITSPGSACGKTTLCLNLAFSFARQRDIKTMVIDLDMRRPSIDKLLNPTGQRSFANALERESAPEEHMLCFERKLAFATNSMPAKNPAELLQDKGSAHVIDRLEERYKPDVMLFDTTPMLACDDTYAFLDQIDCVLLVAAADSTTAEELEKCESEISARTNLMGVVLNKCRYLNKADSYGY